MKTGKLILALVFLMLFADASMAAKWKAKHVVLIGLDGWGAYSVNKAEMPNVKKLMEEGILYVEKTLCTSVFQCRKLGFHVYGGRDRNFMVTRNGDRKLRNCLPV